MNSIVYVGMDVHKNSYSLCCYDPSKQVFFSEVTTKADYKMIVRYLKKVKERHPEIQAFQCGYEAGGLGFSLYKNLTAVQISCVIMAPSTIYRNGSRVKTDRLDARRLAQALAFGGYHAVHIPDDEDEQTREFLRMRDFYKRERKKVKQAIIAFCQRQGFVYSTTKHYWTIAHLKWLKNLTCSAALYQEILDEYLHSYDELTNKLERLDQRVEELAFQDRYQEGTAHLCCFRGISVVSALAIQAEIGDFSRFATAKQLSAYLGLVPGEASSGEHQCYTSLTKAGNKFIRTLLIEASQSYGRGSASFKSKAVKARQKGQPAAIIHYADKATHRLMTRFRRMQLRGLSHNVIKAATARELACFIWGMMTGHIEDRPAYAAH